MDQTKLAEIALHAAAIAAAIRLIVRLARSPLLGFAWNAVPVRLRPLVLLLLGALATALEALAAGRPWTEALFIGLGGVGGAVTSHEMQARSLPPRAPSNPLIPGR